MPPPVTCASACARSRRRRTSAEVETRRGEQVVARVVLVLEHTAHEREAVRMHACRRETDHRVTFLDARPVDQTAALDEPDTCSREVELLLAVDPRQLRRLTADEGHARLATDLRGALHEVGNRLEVDAIRRDVVEEEERIGSARASRR